LITDDLMVSPELVGHSAEVIARTAGISVPPGTRVLICPLDGVGKSYPLSREKLSPVLAYYVVEDWHEGCERCMELLRFGGLGHTLVIHSRDRDVILEFGLRKPAHRVLVNTVSALGAVGYTTSLFPSMTLGCGSLGNNITSDNIGPQHLLNVKRLAYETRPLAGSRQAPAMSASTPPSALESRISEFLTDRGVLRNAGASPPGAGRNTVVAARGPQSMVTAVAPQSSSDSTSQAPACRSSTPSSGCSTSSTGERDTASGEPSSAAPAPPRSRSPIAPRLSRQPPAEAAATSKPPAPAEPAPVAPLPSPEVAEFVGEADVREAMAKGEKISIGPATIITPLGRELGEEHGVFRRQ
jgi:acetaldehyde dehydrogenase (acetylating)